MSNTTQPSILQTLQEIAKDLLFLRATDTPLVLLCWPARVPMNGFATKLRLLSKGSLQPDINYQPPRRHVQTSSMISEIRPSK